MINTDFEGWVRAGVEINEAKINKVGNMQLGSANCNALPSCTRIEFSWDVPKLEGNAK